MLTALCAVAPAVLYYAYPYEYGYLISEDNFGESTTFAAFLLASLLFFHLAARSDRQSGWPWFALLSVACLVMAAEEVSWGQRFIGVPTPDAIRQVNVQGELNFHNIDDEALWSVYTVVTVAIALYGILVPVLRVRFERARKLADALYLPWPSLSVAPLFLAPVAYWALTDFARKDEVVELFTSLAFVTFAADAWQRRTPGMHPQAAGAVSVAVVLVVVLLIGIALPYVSNPPKSLRHTLLVNASTLLPASGHQVQAERVFSELERRADRDDLSDLLLSRASFLAQAGRRDEERATYQRVIGIESVRLETDPGNLDSIEALLAAHMGSGQREAAGQFLALLDRRIDSLVAELQARTSGDSTRPEWAAEHWDRERAASDRISRMYIRIGDAHAVFGNRRIAIEYYLLAAEHAAWGNTRRFLAGRYLTVAKRFGCSGDLGMPLDLRSVQRALEQNLNLCAD